jgi:protein O-mannosyl-transferase
LRDKKNNLLFYLLIILLASLPFLSLVNAEFVHWDDDVYVCDNQRVQNGLTPENVKWAFSTIYFGFYYPVTWLSHMLDCSLFGLKAGGHHLTNIIIHMLNSLLLFTFFRRATSEKWKSFVLSAIFAVHPLNVESIAWISERKNLLAGLFFFLGLNLYLNYVKSSTKFNYVKLFLCYLLGLMSKSVIVTFPLALCMIDIWPLKRLKLNFGAFRESRKVLLEKWPLFIPVPVFACLTILAQQKISALATLTKYPFDQRLAGAFLAYARYIYQFLLPLELTAYYPHLKNNYSSLNLFLSIVFLSFITYIFFRLYKFNNCYLWGWFWFLGHLVPVIGLIQVGGQASADRYMYIPMVGLIAIVVFGLAPDLQVMLRLKKQTVAAVLFVAMSLLIIKSCRQTLIWKDSEALFSTMNGSPGHYNMGLIYKKKGEFLKAIEFYKKAIQHNPEKAEAFNNLGNCYSALNDNTNAFEAYKTAAELDPYSPIMRFNLGLSEEILGNSENAKSDFEKALRLADDDPQLKKRITEALESLRSTK